MVALAFMASIANAACKPCVSGRCLGQDVHHHQCLPNAVETNVFNGYYRNASSEPNGNFTSTIGNWAGLTNQRIGLLATRRQQR